ncbi:MAG: glycosyltransferase family 2 protein [Candidatus Omnitrophica bacterium]|nr:glycosyltransferase family 2 protein [Candidatus Omnitrophota bacterium]
MLEKCELSLILSCYNEGIILKDNFKNIIDLLNIMRFNYEIIFIDDCSIDSTRMIIDEIINTYRDIKIIKIFHSKNEGRGKSVSDGFKQASGEVVGYIDVDLEVSPNYIAECVLKIRESYDVVFGWRIYKFHFYYWQRYMLSKAYIWLVSILCRTPIMDTESGYKFFKKDKIMPLLNEVCDSHWFWDTEILLRAYYKRFKIGYIPVLFLKNFNKKSTVNIFKDVKYYFIKLIKFRKNIKSIKNESA